MVKYRTTCIKVDVLRNIGQIFEKVKGQFLWEKRQSWKIRTNIMKIYTSLVKRTKLVENRK